MGVLFHDGAWGGGVGGIWGRGGEREGGGREGGGGATNHFEVVGSIDIFPV